MTYQIEVASGRDLTRERWEIYSDWREDPRLLEARIFYRLPEPYELK
jgi:hypothetical protein